MISSFKKWFPTWPNSMVRVERYDSIKSLAEQVLKPVFSLPRRNVASWPSGRKHQDVRAVLRVLRYSLLWTVSLNYMIRADQERP
jgi:hypothetical protein